MMGQFELPLVLGGIAMIIFAEMFNFDPVNSAKAEGERAVQTIEEQVRTVPYDRSCLADGTFVTDGTPNCFESSGYRFVRIGLGVMIEKAGDGGSPTVVYARNVGDGRRVIVHDEVVALAKLLTRKNPFLFQQESGR